MLSQIADGKHHETANARGAELRAALNDVFRKAGAPMVAYGDVSVCHISLDGAARGRDEARREPRPQVALRADPPWAWTCRPTTAGSRPSHGDREIEETAVAVKKAVADLQAERALP